MDATSNEIFNNGTNYIFMNDDESFIHKYYLPFLPSKNHEDVSSGSYKIQQNEEYSVIRRLF